MSNAKERRGAFRQDRRPQHSSHPTSTRSSVRRYRDARGRQEQRPQTSSSSGKAATRVLLTLALIIILVSAGGLALHRMRTHRQVAAPSIEEVSGTLVEEHDLQGVMAQIDQTIMEQGEAEFLGASQEQLVSSYYLPCTTAEASDEVGRVFESRGWKDLGFGEPGEMVIYGHSTQEPEEPDRAVVMFIEEEDGCTVVIEFLRWGSAS